MAKPPKRYYDLNPDDLQFAEILFSHDNDAWAHTVSVRVLIRALLDNFSGEYINREALTDRLLKLVLRDNAFYKDIATSAKDGAGIAQLSAVFNIVGVAKSTRQDIQTILEDSSRQHSRVSITEHSDEILKLLDSHPYPFGKSPSSLLKKQQNDWLKGYMPKILGHLKGDSLCPVVCPARTTWPPIQSKTPTRRKGGQSESTIESLEDFSCLATAAAGLKNAILAYYHGISVKTLNNNYLQNRLPKIARKGPHSSSLGSI